MASCHGAHGTGQQFTYAQLQGLWINAGGSRSLAPLMAAIAMAESAGCSSAFNASGASGLWQIMMPLHANLFSSPGQVWDPASNARAAVSIYHSQGLGAWETYTNGAYRAFFNGSTTPNTNVPGPGAGSSSTATLTAAQQTGPGCLLANPFSTSLPLIGNVSAGPACLITNANVRAWIGGALMMAAVPIGLVGFAALVAVGFRRTGAGQAAGRVAGGTLETAGAALAFVPGAEPAGLGIAAAGHTVRRGVGAGATGPGRAAQGRRARRNQRHKQQAADERELERKSGTPRMNPEIRTGRGAVRETPAETRRRRAAGDQAASKAAARRMANPPKTGSREAVPF